MGQTEYADTFIRNMLNWVRWLGNQVTAAFQSGSAGGGFFSWFSANWLKILIVLVILGIVIDWLIWMVRWRPYWLWFRKKRVLLDAEQEDEDLDARDHDKLMEYGAYDELEERRKAGPTPHFTSRALSRHSDDEGEDEEDDLWAEEPRAAKRSPASRYDAYDEEDEDFDDFDDAEDPFDDFDDGRDQRFDEGLEDEEDEDLDDEDFDDEDFDEDDFDEEEDEDRPGIGDRFRGLLSGLKLRRGEDDEYDEDDEEYDDEEEEDDELFDAFDEEDEEEDDDWDAFEADEDDGRGLNDPEDDDFFDGAPGGLSFMRRGAEEEDFAALDNDEEEEAPLPYSEPDHSIYARPTPLDPVPQVLSFERPFEPVSDTDNDDWHTGYTQRTPIIDANTPGLSRKARRRIKDAEQDEDEDE